MRIQDLIPLILLSFAPAMALASPPEPARRDAPSVDAADAPKPAAGAFGPDDMRILAPELVGLDIPHLPETLFQQLAAVTDARSARFLSWSLDGGLLIGTRFSDAAQVHHLSGPGAARRQLTFNAEPTRSAIAATRAGRPGFIASRDAGGAEGYQLFFHDSDIGTVTQLTDGASRNMGAKVSRDGHWLAFSSTARNGTDYDIWLLDLTNASAKPTIAAERSGYWLATDWSPDGRRLLLQHYVSANDSTVHFLDLTTNSVRPVMPATEPSSYAGGARYAPDGRGILLVSDRFTGRRDLIHRRPDGGATSVDLGIPWDVEALEVAPKGGFVAVSLNVGGISTLKILRARGGRFKSVKLPELPVGVLRGMGFSPDGKRLALSLDSATATADVFVLSVRKRRLTRWTESELGGLESADFVAPTLIRFPTFDTGANGAARQIPAFYYKPKTTGPHPVVVMIHGGPESQYRPRFSPIVQHWVTQMGIAVIAPNVRGSAGYGRDYLLLDNGFKREDSVKDIGALLDWVAIQPDLDAQRVAVYGGSYGGYMVLASMVHYADRLVAGADIVGISNFVTFLKNTKDYRRDLRRAEYGDERDPKMRAHLEAISPSAHADKITDPLFVIQGANDPRVPATESAQIVRAIRAGGRPAWYLLAHDEGHGFRKKKNRRVYYAALTEFWRRHLLGEGERE